ncbi:MAG: helix-turn-helix domain-containing protein [Chitinophagaceae bacterium]|nr:MAG: helix-turn-helix domain-containing protein [Chitinophagaceae bacterium]
MFIFMYFCQPKLSTHNPRFDMTAFAERLKSARKMKGWSLQDLSDNLTLALSKQALSKYEQGEMNPGSDVLIALANALDVKPDYFLREPIELGEIAFRKTPDLSAKEIDRITELVKDHLERYLEVEELLGITTQFKSPIKDKVISDPEQIDGLVAQLNKAWNLGYDPIPNVIDMLEEHNVKVIEIDADDKFDGLSTWVDKIPVVVVSKHYSVERKRFTALHELGHLVLSIDKGADEERICHAFAGAMLLPDGSLEKLLGNKRKNIAMGELVSIKEQFGISIQAIMMRAQLKGIVDKTFVSKFWRAIGGNKKEIGLGKFKGNEKSYRFQHLVFRLAAEEIVSLSKAANLAGKKLAQFREELDAPETK